MGRGDGTLIADIGPLRRMLPSLMPSRNGAVVYYEQQLDLTKTLAWLKRRELSITLYELAIAGLVRVWSERPQLNRFVAGGKLYQRDEIAFSISVKKSLDDQAYLQRVTPRTARSNWSKRNREHAERLISEGRMTESGLVHIRAAKADGRWQNAYAASEMKVPADFLAALESKPKAKQFFETLNKSSRYVIAYGLTSAKKPETRQRRFAKFIDMLARKEKPT